MRKLDLEGAGGCVRGPMNPVWTTDAPWWTQLKVALREAGRAWELEDGAPWPTYAPEEGEDGAVYWPPEPPPRS